MEAVADPELGVFDLLADEPAELPFTRVRPEAKLPAPQPLKTDKELVQEQLLSIQDELYRESMEVMLDSMAFRELPPESKFESGPPQEWIDRYGEERAIQRYRVALASWMNTKDSPVALRHTTQVALGIIKAKATEKSAPRSLNIAVFMTRVDAPEPEFPVIEVEGG